MKVIYGQRIQPNVAFSIPYFRLYPISDYIREVIPGDAGRSNKRRNDPAIGPKEQSGNVIPGGSL